MNYGSSLYGRNSSDLDALRRLGVEVPEPTTEGSLLNLRPGGFGSDLRALGRGEPPAIPAVDPSLAAEPLSAPPTGEVAGMLGRAPVPPEHAIKGAATGYDAQVNTRRLGPREQIKAAAGGSPRFLAPPAPALDLTSATESLSRPMLSYRGEDLPATPDRMQPPEDPTNLRDPLVTEMERRAPSLREYNATPTRDEYLEQNRPQGVGGRLLSGLKLGGKLLVASGLNPLAAAEGLGIGLADRDANARFTYNTDVEPHQRRLLSYANQEMGLANTVEDNRRANEQMQQQGELGRLTADWHRSQIEGQQKEWKERLQEKTLNDWMARNPGVPIPRQIAEQVGHPYLSGYTPPARKATGKGPAPHVLWNEKTGEVGVVVYDDDGNPSVVKPQGGRMTPSPDIAPEWAADPNPPDFDASIKKKMDEWRQGHYATLGITPETVEMYPELKQRAEASLYERAKDSVEADAKRRKAGNRTLGPRPGSSPSASTSKRPANKDPLGLFQ